MTNSVLLEIGKVLGFKLGANSIFGARNGQIIQVRYQDGYSIKILLKPETLFLFKSIEKTQNLSKFLNLEKISIRVYPNGPVEFKVRGKLGQKATVSKLLTWIENISNSLSKHQIFNGTISSNTILIDDEASPHDEVYLQQKKDEKLTRSKKPINEQAGFMLGFFGGIAIAMILGFLSSLGRKHSGSDLNPFGKGIFSLGIAASLYLKAAGGLSKKSRLLVAFLGLATYTTWDLSLVFFEWFNHDGTILSFSSLLEIYKNHFSNLSASSKMSLVAMASVFVGGIFLRTTDSPILRIDEGLLLTGESLTRIENIKRSERWSGGLILSEIILGVIVFSFYIFESDRREIMFPASLIPYVFVFQCLSVLIFHNVVQKWEIFQLAFTNYKYRSKGPVYYWMLINFSSVLLNFSLIFLLLNLNFKLDRSPIYIEKARLNEEIFGDVKRCKSFQLLMLKDNSKFDFRLCKYLRGSVGEIAEVSFRKGFFDIPYIEGVSIPSLNNFEEYLKSGRKEKDIRVDFATHFYEVDKSEEFAKRIQEWEKICLRSSGYECRLRSYIYSINKDHSKALKLLQRSCFSSESTSCRGVILNEVATAKEKNEAVNVLKSNCLNEVDESCMELVWSYISLDHVKFKKEIEGLLTHACKRRHKEACSTLEIIKNI